MKNPDLNIRIGVIAALEQVLSIPIRDSMPGPRDALPYVLLSSQTNISNNTKTSFGTQSTLMIQVVGKKSLTVSRYEVDGIMDTIIEKIIPQSTDDYVSVDGFQVVHTELDSMTDNVIHESDGNSVNKLARIRFILRELDLITT